MINIIKVLIIDDSCKDIETMQKLLENANKIARFELLYEKSLKAALDRISQEKFDCILLDLNLPDSKGIDTFTSISTIYPESPIIILTILDDNDTVIQSIQEGAQDYLVKGFITGDIISRSIRYAIERKKIENSLRESEKKYKEIIDTILEGFWMVDKDAKTTHVNKQLAEMLGYSQDEMLGHPFFEFVNENFRDDARDFFERRKKGIKDRYDFCYNKKDGSILWAIVSASPIYDDKTKFAGAMGLITDITERKLTEESLENAVYEWYSTFNAIRDAICITDIEGKILRYNDAAHSFFGDDIIGGTCWENMCNHECKRKLLEECPLKRVQETGCRESKAIQMGEKWFFCSVDPLTDNEKNIIGGVHIISDITKYKHIQDELREGEERWRMLTENSPEYIITTDIEGNIQFINRTITLNKEDVIGTSIYNYVPDKFRQTITDCLEKVKKTKEPDIYYTEYIKDGGTLYFVSNVGPIIKSNNVVGLIISSSDITERKKMEDMLRESEERYRTIIEYSNDSIWTLDNEGYFTFANKRTEKITGYKSNDLKNKTLYSLIIKKDMQKTEDTFGSVLHGQPQEFEVTLANKYDKHKTLLVSIAPIYSKGQIIGTANFGKDITENIKAREKIKKTAEDLERSNKELEQFAYIASHDLQEPLRSISSFTELLGMRYRGKLDKDADEFIDYILNGSKRMQQMINDLLALSRVGTRGKEFKPTNVNNILEDVLKNLHSMIERNQATINIDDMPIVDADSSQLAQLFQNLIDNAIKFRRDENPIINISARQIIEEERDKENKEWLFSIEDNGIGIDIKDFNKLFVIFQRLHSRDEYPGTGIGLAMCKKIITRHGGKIWVESTLGKGSTFYFTIPIRTHPNT